MLARQAPTAPGRLRHGLVPAEKILTKQVNPIIYWLITTAATHDVGEAGADSPGCLGHGLVPAEAQLSDVAVAGCGDGGVGAPHEEGHVDRAAELPLAAVLEGSVLADEALMTTPESERISSSAAQREETSSLQALRRGGPGASWTACGTGTGGKRGEVLVRGRCMGGGERGLPCAGVRDLSRQEAAFDSQDGALVQRARHSNTAGSNQSINQLHVGGNMHHEDYIVNTRRYFLRQAHSGRKLSS